MRNKAENKSRYSDEDLAEFELLIDNKLAESRQQLDFYLSQLSLSSDVFDNKARGLDDGTGTSASEQNTNMAARLQKHVKHLENAKIRIQNKIYGVCRETGVLISKERLRAVPHATLSIQAKKK
ncbi:MAG: DnaK suppressor protein [Polaribacter sp.]|jgi:DnaK suppressor protein